MSFTEFWFAYRIAGEPSKLTLRTAVRGPGTALCVGLDQPSTVRSLFSSAYEAVVGLRFDRFFARVPALPLLALRLATVRIPPVLSLSALSSWPRPSQ